MDIRIDPITQQPVILATSRVKRPHFGKSKPTHPPIDNKRTESSVNPFAPGNEHITGPEVWADSDNENRKSNDPDWKVRVIPNKYPIAKHHEVIIYSQHPRFDFPALSLKQATRIVKAFIARGKEMQKHGQPFLFCNHGVEAGASIEQPHAQVLAFPALPPAIKTEVDVLQKHYNLHGNCAYCQLIEHEEKVGKRLIWQNDSFILMTPEASGWPYAIALMPKIHQAAYTALKDRQVLDFTQALRIMISLYNHVLINPSYNFWVHSTKDSFYHWHLDMIPRLKIAGGVEVGAGIIVNDRISPEDAAKKFRLALKEIK